MYARKIVQSKFHMQEKSPIKKNILQYIEYKGISKYKFYQETGITRGGIRSKQWDERGKYG